MLESKTCVRCWQSRLYYDFHKDAGKADGLMSWCIDCVKEARDARGTSFPVTVEQKTCTSCLKVKSAECFGVRQRNKDGLNNKCLVCAARNDRKYRLMTGRTKKSNGRQKAVR